MINTLINDKILNAKDIYSIYPLNIKMANGVSETIDKAVKLSLIIRRDSILIEAKICHLEDQMLIIGLQTSCNLNFDIQCRAGPHGRYVTMNINNIKEQVNTKTPSVNYIVEKRPIMESTFVNELQDSEVFHSTPIMETTFKSITSVDHIIDNTNNNNLTLLDPQITTPKLQEHTVLPNQCDNRTERLEIEIFLWKKSF